MVLVLVLITVVENFSSLGQSSQRAFFVGQERYKLKILSVC